MEGTGWVGMMGYWMTLHDASDNLGAGHRGEGSGVVIDTGGKQTAHFQVPRGKTNMVLGCICWKIKYKANEVA